MRKPAPVALFAFNRPVHLRQTLSALAANELADQSDLVIFCDGPRHSQDQDCIRAVLAVADATEGFASCRVVRRPVNVGLGESIISGVTEMLRTNERVIVLEDDLITSPYFLRYINEGLDLYAEDFSVASIHGWCFPHFVVEPPETFFLMGTDCWGWGTWKRAWDLFEADATILLSALQKRKRVHAFNCNGTYDYAAMLEAVGKGTINSWAVRWRAAAFLHNMYTLYPGHSLVQHEGNDGQGTNTGVTNLFDVPLTQAPVQIVRQPIQEHRVMREASMTFHARLGCKPTLLKALKRRLCAIPARASR